MDREPIDPDYGKEWQRIGFVLDQFNELEREMAEAIAAYARPVPSRKAFVLDYMMHTSIMQSSAKVKLVLAIAREASGPKVTRDHLLTAMKYRNALAHFRTFGGIRSNWNAMKSRMSDDDDNTPYGVYLVVETLDGQDLKLVSRLRIEVIGDALVSIDAARKEIAELRKHLDSMPVT